MFFLRFQGRGGQTSWSPLDFKPEGDGIFWIAVAKIPKVS